MWWEKFGYCIGCPYRGVCFYPCPPVMELIDEQQEDEEQEDE